MPIKTFPGVPEGKVAEVERMRAATVADAKRRDAFARQAVKVKKVAARTVGSGRARGR